MSKGTKIHESVTATRVMEACEARMTDCENPGICLGCGMDHYYCEPDARRYLCEGCDKHLVFGAEEIMLMGAYHKD